MHRLSLAASRCHSPVAVGGLLTVEASLGVEHRCQSLGLRVRVRVRVSYPMACGVFPDQDSNHCPPCISRWILNHRAIKEVLRAFSMHVASSVITTKPACRGKGIQPPRGMILAVTFRPKEDHGGAQYHFAEQAECYYSEPNKGLAHRYLE